MNTLRFHASCLLINSVTNILATSILLGADQALRGPALTGSQQYVQVPLGGEQRDVWSPRGVCLTVWEGFLLPFCPSLTELKLFPAPPVAEGL